MANFTPMGDPASQYHHFVPQFILNDFAHNFEPTDLPKSQTPTDQGTTPKKKKKKDKKPKCHFDKGNLKKYRGDKVVNNINLLQSPYVIDESPVKRILGQPDMYRDKTRVTKKEQLEVEEKFSIIESQAQRVIRKITKAFDDGEKAVCLPRPERDLIRKFLFLLKYRGSGFHRRFYHEDVQSYSADDKGIFSQYMRDHGFERPIQVWLQSLKTIMALEMDPNLQWVEKIRNQMYTPDADWLIAHTQMMYMAICTPSRTSDEFILTDNSYNIFEGPNDSAQDIRTGEICCTGHVHFHEFAPISHKLILVLRSHLLPVPEEDYEPQIREIRNREWYTAVEDVFGPSVKSSLEARNSYSDVVDGRLIRLEGEHGQFNKNDRFYFYFSPLETGHVNKINKILLENSHECSRIIFRTQDSFLRTLESYMTEPQIVTGMDAERKVEHLHKLDRLMKAMGSTKVSRWISLPCRPILDSEKHYRKFTAFHLYMQGGALMDNSFAETYRSLSDSPILFFKDWEQSGRMRQLRIKIDSWSRLCGVDEAVRNRNRILLTEVYKRLPPARFWLYMKRVRMMLMSPEHMFITVQPLVELCTSPRFREGPEDIFGKVQNYVRPERLNHLVYATVMNDTNMKLNRDLNRWYPETCWMNEWRRYEILREYVLRVPGKIRDCGIEEIERLAAIMEELMIRQEMHKRREFNDPRFSDEEKIEMGTRLMVRQEFKRAMSLCVGDELASLLYRVFFTYTYPTPNTDSD